MIKENKVKKNLKMSGHCPRVQQVGHPAGSPVLFGGLTDIFLEEEVPFSGRLVSASLLQLCLCGTMILSLKNKAQNWTKQNWLQIHPLVCHLHCRWKTLAVY